MDRLPFGVDGHRFPASSSASLSGKRHAYRSVHRRRIFACARPLRILRLLQFTKFAPPLVLLSLGGIRIFVVLQPKSKPVEISFIDCMAVGRLPFLVIFTWKHIRIERLTGVLQVPKKRRISAYLLV